MFLNGYRQINTIQPYSFQREPLQYLGGALKNPNEIPTPIIEPMKESEKPIVKEILEMLNEMKFPSKNPSKDKTRSNVLKKKTDIIEAFVLGKVRAYDKPDLVGSVQNKKFPQLHKLLNRLVRTHNPNFRFTSIQINKSVGTDWHFDRGNRGLSYCLGIGNFDGGGVVVKFQDGKEKLYDNHNKWLKYDGHSLEHKSHPHSGGIRYAIIFYTHF